MDLINDEAVLLLKVLNLEKHGREGAVLNHFNRVSGREAVEFLQDFLPVGVANETSPLGSRGLRFRMAQHGEPGTATNDVTTLNRTLITEAEALVRLRSFDISTIWGPSRSCTRRQRRDRLTSLGRPIAGWEWVEEIFSQHPELADVKTGENRKATMNQLQATVTESAPIISSSIADPCMALEARAVPGTLHQLTHRYNPYARCSQASSESQIFGAFKSQSTGHRKGLPRVLTSNAAAGAAKIPRGVANYFQRTRGPQFSAAPLESLRACEVGFGRGRGGGDCGFIIHRPAAARARSWRRLRRGDGCLAAVAPGH